MAESQTCCCMFSAKTGVYILSCLAFVSLISEAEGFEAPRFGANLGIVASFIVMFFLDTASHRRNFFFCYVLGNFIMLIYTFYMIQRAMFKQNPWVIGCD